jgi:hypothetical protein
MSKVALARALTRIRFHGWRHGRPMERSDVFRGVKFNGYSLYDAVVGLKGEVSDLELKALHLLAIAILDPRVDIGSANIKDIIDSWNDEPGRTLYDVERAISAALDAPENPRAFFLELCQQANRPHPEGEQ